MTAPPLVLVPSLGTSGAMWAPQVDALGTQFDILIVDHPGHGAARPATGPLTIDDLGRHVVAALDAHGVERAPICGLSLGGMAAMWVAANAPARVDRLVLACTAPHLPPAHAWHDRAAFVRANGTEALLDTLLGRWFTPAFAARPEVRDEFDAMLSTVDSESYARCCEAIAAMDLRGELGRIDAPTLVIAGAHDPVTTPGMALDLQRRIRGAGLTVIDDAAHLASYEQPARFSAAVLEHLRQD